MISELKELLHRLETEDRPTVTCEHVDALAAAIKKLQGPPIREMVEDPKFKGTTDRIIQSPFPKP